MENLKREPLLISACLLGVHCRYDGGGLRLPQAEALRDAFYLVPVCCEVLGGMTTPRLPSELRDGRVWSRDGRDVTDQFRRGAAEILELARFFGCRKALLKERSPSCGFGTIYDGSFSGGLTQGSGVLAQLLHENGFAIWGESQVEALLAGVK